jgi:hypothetical protein
MTPASTINPAMSPGPAAALERLAWAERRRAAASHEAEQARRRLADAVEQLHQARQAATAEGVLRGGGEMVGMGYFADEVALVEGA